MRRDIIETALNVLHRDLRRIANFPLSRAETAIHRALARDQKEYAVRVSMSDRRHGRHRVLIQRIVRRIEVGEFFFVRHTLEPDGISFVPNERKIIRVYASLKEV